MHPGDEFDRTAMLELRGGLTEFHGVDGIPGEARASPDRGPASLIVANNYGA